MMGRKTRTLTACVGAVLILALSGTSSHVTSSSAGARARQSGGAVASAASTSALAAAVRPSRTWQRLPRAPIPATYISTSVWTGREMLIFGRASRLYPALDFDAMASYRPASRTWRRLPPGPGRKEATEGSDVAVWTGKEMIVWGITTAAFNPSTTRWRAVPRSPITGRAAPTLVVWTGRQMIGWGGGCCGESAADGAAYTPSTNSWQKLPASPLAGRYATGAWTGRDLIIAGGSNAENKVFADAAAYTPATRSWRRLARLPVPLTQDVAVWDGHEVLLVGGRTQTEGRLHLLSQGFAYNPVTNRWRRLPSMGPGRLGAVAVWSRRQLLVWGGETLRGNSWVAPPHGVAYEPARNRWTPLPASPLRGRTLSTAAWTGSQMIVWGGRSIEAAKPPSFNDGAAYTP